MIEGIQIAIKSLFCKIINCHIYKSIISSNPIALFNEKGKKNCFGRLLLNFMDILIRNIIFPSFHIKCRCKVKVLLQNKYRFRILT